MQFHEQKRQEVKKAVQRYRKEVKEIQDSPNPYYQDKAVQDYEIGRLRDKLEADVSDIKSEFDGYIGEAIESQKEKAARSSFRVTQSDRDFVDAQVSEFLASVKMAYTDDKKAEKYLQFEREVLEYMNEAELSYLRTQLPKLMEASEGTRALDTKLRGLNATLEELKTEEQAELERLEHIKMSGVDYDFRRLTITHPTFKHLENNRSQ